MAPYAPAAVAPPVATEAAAAAAIPRRADIAVVLPPSDAADRTALETLIAGARDDLVRRLAVDPPARLAATFHASAADYEKASGHPWFTSGAVAGGVLHFLPAAVLRDRGVLERTVRRGLVAQLTASSLAGRPLWIREGIAGYFADPDAPLPETRGSCPSDAELAQPVSAGALGDAYARARACVARQITGGRSWREVR
jgi:hypothetical protein